MKFRPTPTEFKENFYWFILCFRKFGAFSIFLYPQDQKRVDFAIFWLLASRKEENFYLQVEKVEKVDSGTPVLQLKLTGKYTWILIEFFIDKFLSYNNIKQISPIAMHR